MNSYNTCDIIINIKESDIKFLFDNEKDSYLNVTLRQYIHNVKTQIDKDVKRWEKNKKFSNPYEFINTNIDTMNPCICSHKPISRSFFKMIEILNSGIFSFHTQNIKSFHLAEGPGGFIEALLMFRKNKKDIYYGITLMDKNNDVPKWTKSEKFLRQNKNVNILYGSDNTGNLYHRENLIHIKNKFNNSIDFITGDGGFDYSVDFNKQEENSINLIFSEICFAIMAQKKGGHFVLKIFDSFHSCTVKMLYFLNYLYEEVYIMKPSSSRIANSEKYVICKTFKSVHNLNDIQNTIISQYNKIKTNKLTSILSCVIPNAFIEKIIEINAIFGQQQIENIQFTLNNNYDEKENKIEQTKASNINKCIKWCKKYNMPINDLYVI